ncbi:hypothetical protein [Floccifex sp.]|uniref:hypothetical protein n=1 Tax=Floccifex sp. TaxID=2815810 RepID=UPI003F0E9065
MAANEKKLYAIYDHEGILAFLGWSDECMKYLDMTKGSFYCFVTRCAKKKDLKSYKGHYHIEVVGNMEDF